MTDPSFKNLPAYLDAHCAAFNGWALPTASNEFEQQAIDRGHWDGLQARDAALASAVRDAEERKQTGRLGSYTVAVYLSGIAKGA